jgi:hypothetical protein
MAASSDSNTIALPVKRKPSLPGDFGHRSFGGQVAPQNHQMTIRFDRLVKRLEDGLVRRVGRDILAASQPLFRP